jgi:hypothetical protein
MAVLSPHRPLTEPHAPEDQTMVILGFADRGSPDLAASVVGRNFISRRVAGQISDSSPTGSSAPGRGSRPGTTHRSRIDGVRVALNATAKLNAVPTVVELLIRECGERVGQVEDCLLLLRQSC